MARRKNVKRIDPRYFLHETVDRNDDGSALEVTPPRARPGLKESTEPSVARLLWDMFTKPTAQQRDLDPSRSERELDRASDAEQAARDMERPVPPEAPETYGRPHALKTRVNEAEDPTPPAMSQWAELFPRAAQALYDALRAMGGAEMPGLVKHSRTPEDRAAAEEELAAAVQARGPNPPSSWGKYEEGK